MNYNPGRLNLEADCLNENPVLELDNEQERLQIANIISRQVLYEIKKKKLKH